MRLQTCLRCKGDRGTGLIELMVVLVSAAVLLATAAPGFEKLKDEWTLWGAGRLLEASLQWGRMHSISTNLSLMLQVAADGRSFWWVDPRTGGKYDHSVRYLPGAARIDDSPRSSLRFHPRGNAAPAGTYVVVGDAGSYRVVVNFAGRIRVARD